MCDRSTTCSNDGTCQLILRNGLTGMKTFEYYCKAHLVTRVWDLEDDDTLEVVDAILLE